MQATECRHWRCFFFHNFQPYLVLNSFSCSSCLKEHSTDSWWLIFFSKSKLESEFKFNLVYIIFTSNAWRSYVTILLWSTICYDFVFIEVSLLPSSYFVTKARVKKITKGSIINKNSIVFPFRVKFGDVIWSVHVSFILRLKLCQSLMWKVNNRKSDSMTFLSNRSYLSNICLQANFLFGFSF